MPPIPKMEDLICRAHHEPNFIEYVPPNRFFAVIANGYVGIYTRVEAVSDFLAYFHPTLLKEFTSFDDALWHINWFYMRRVFPLTAYCGEPIRYLKGIPLDTAVPANFLDSISSYNFPSGMKPTYPELMPPSPVN